MKRCTRFILTILTALTLAISLCACSSDTDNGANSPSPEISITTAYNQAVELGFTGSLEEFIALISGKDGENGRGVSNVSVNADGELIVTFTDYTTVNAGSVIIKCSHSYSDWQTVEAVTCTSIGYDTRRCSKCGDVDYRFTEQLGHDYGNAVTVIKEHCTDTGLKVLTCSRCGDTQAQAIAPKGHGLSYPSMTCVYCGKNTQEIYLDENFNFKLIDNDTAYEISGKPGAEGELVIPAEYKGLPVTQIARTGFANCKSITKVVIPEGITKINQYEFANCTGLKTIVIPKTVTDIKVTAFLADNIENIEIDSENPAYFGDGSYIAEVTTKTLIYGNSTGYIPDDGSVEHIGNRAFYRRNIPNIVIPEGIKTIATGAFYYNRNIKSVTIPSTVTSISSNAFNYSVIDESITVAPANTAYKSVGNCLIEIASKTLLLGCNNSVIPADGSITTIGSYAFIDCEGITEVAIPNGVTTIGGNAFMRTSLNKISLPDTLEFIGYDAFYGTPYIRDKNNWSNGALYIGKFLIETDSSLPDEYTVKDGTLAIACNAFEFGSVKKLIIPDSVKIIGNSAFRYCRKLTDITIGTGVRIIGSYAFDMCDALERVTLSDPASWGRRTSITEFEPIPQEDLSDSEKAAEWFKIASLINGSSQYGYVWSKVSTSD